MLSERRIWGEVPAGFKEIKSARARLIVRQDRVGVLDLATCRQAEVSGISTGLEGRKSLGAVKLETGETVLIRPYHHGGILRAVTRRVFFSWPPRPFQELAITEELRRRGVPTVEPYAACVERLRGPFYRGWLLTRQLEEAHDLWAALQNGFVGRLGSEQVLRAAARSVRSMHTEGVYHTDLNLKNILVREEGGGVRAYVIDFDKAKLLLGGLPEWLVRRNLDRLLRSARKLDPQRRYFSPCHWDQFIRFYYASD